MREKASGQVPATSPAPGAGIRNRGAGPFAPRPARRQLENPDIGMLSTVRVGPWEPGG
jgi:hypothetical protein